MRPSVPWIGVTLSGVLLVVGIVIGGSTGTQIATLGPTWVGVSTGLIMQGQKRDQDDDGDPG